MDPPPGTVPLLDVTVPGDTADGGSPTYPAITHPLPDSGPQARSGGRLRPRAKRPPSCHDPQPRACARIACGRVGWQSTKRGGRGDRASGPQGQRGNAFSTGVWIARITTDRYATAEAGGKRAREKGGGYPQVLNRQPTGLLTAHFGQEQGMRPVKRSGVSKGRSARQFKRNVRRTKGANVAPPPMRGGFRL